MNSNRFGLQTLTYIWTHPNCKTHRVQAILKFWGWQLYKRLLHRSVDIQLTAQIKIRCHPRGYAAAAVLYCGLYDYDEMNFLLRYLRPEDSFLDIGANVGVYTLLAATKIHSGTIYSIEALPKNYDRLQENLALNQLTQVKTYPIAVSDRTGTIELNLADTDSMSFVTQTATENTISVPTDTLENLILGQAIDYLTLAKIDIEGAELLAFKGAASLLDQHRPPVWILEINQAVEHFGHTQQDVVNLLHHYGYHLYHYSADRNQISSITLEQQQGNNVIAIADSWVDFVRDRLAEASCG